MSFDLSILVLAIPLFMFLFLGIAGVKMGKKATGWIGTASMLVTLVICYGIALTYFFSTPLVNGVHATIIPYNWDWLSFSSKLVARLGVLIDPISAMMLVVVSTVSFLVHLFSIGYMSDEAGKPEKGFQRYYAFLQLFTFSMLGLVVSTNIFQMFIFFEMVGVSSYLLIGFYYTSPAAIHASKKAFIVTRLADLFFLLGVIVISYYTGTLDFFKDSSHNVVASLLDNPQSTIAACTGSFMGCSAIAWSLTMIFIGGAGKSAMYPLHIWLPDAMEGPTPVSALIHAATMVVAGVFLVARMFPVYVLNPAVMNTILVVGAFTAFYAAAVACVQSDIKRALAFSTISQIAYMMTALAVSTSMTGEGSLGYMASQFHLFTHAMFKALLFLCAGSIIHCIGSNENDQMHGLHKYMPITSICFLIGCLAISGIPPFAGFFSKDEIIVACFHKNVGWGIWMMLVAGMTAFYMFRTYYLIFFWKKHDTPAGKHAPHDMPWTMTLPLIILAAVSCVAGFVPAHDMVTANGAPLETHTEWPVAIASICVAVVGIGLATALYYKENNVPTRMKNAALGLWTAAYHRFYMDEFYQFITHKIIFQAICKPIAWFDRHIIDGFMNLLADGTNSISYSIRKLQGGAIQSYVYVYLMGALAIAIVTMLCVLI